MYASRLMQSGKGKKPRAYFSLYTAKERTSVDRSCLLRCGWFRVVSVDAMVNDFT